jgi:Tfp pilus assembly protein PilF
MPLDPVSPSLLERAQGAFAIQDYAEALNCISAMQMDELQQRETIALRLEIAKATGKHEMITFLEKELLATTQPKPH